MYGFCGTATTLGLSAGKIGEKTCAASVYGKNRLSPIFGASLSMISLLNHAGLGETWRDVHVSNYGKRSMLLGFIALHVQGVYKRKTCMKGDVSCYYS